MEVDDCSNDNSSAADFVPSPSSNHTAAMSHNDGLALDDCARQSSADTAWESLEHQNQTTELHLDPVFKPASQVVIGSQIAFFYAYKKEVDLKPKVNLVVINMSEECLQCGEKVCGPKPVLDKHMVLHKPSVEDESFILLNMCSSLLDPSLESIEPEFVVVPLESIMKKHMLKHKNGEEIIIPERLQPVKCPICYKEMASRSLKDHMKLKHSNARTLASML
ncbi:hypothetical protein B566_EDAN013442 [Ephemera danica]|nr:hypothetical protein B566_EDAN013442 [Ephemera danica]